MLCILFLERLGLFPCFRKHEGFLFSLRQCCVHVLGMGIFGVRLAGFGKGLVAASALSSVSSSSPSDFWCCGSVELHPRTLLWKCIPCGNFFQVYQRISTFFWGAWWPSWSNWAAWCEQSWGKPRHFLAVHVWGFSPQVSGFPLGFHLWTLPSNRPPFMGLGKPGEGRCPQWGLFGFRECAEDTHFWTGLSEIIFRKSVH